MQTLANRLLPLPKQGRKETWSCDLDPRCKRTIEMDNSGSFCKYFVEGDCRQKLEKTALSYKALLPL